MMHCIYGKVTGCLFVCLFCCFGSQVISYGRGGTVSGCNFQKKLYFFHFSLKIVFVLENSVDPDEMPHNAAFHLGLHC